MRQEYEVIEVSGERAYAFELQKRFGLFMFTIEEIEKRWTEYSEKYCAGWMNGTREEVEEVFGVKLKYISQYNY